MPKIRRKTKGERNQNKNEWEQYLESQNRAGKEKMINLRSDFGINDETPFLAVFSIRNPGKFPTTTEDKTAFLSQLL